MSAWFLDRQLSICLMYVIILQNDQKLYPVRKTSSLITFDEDSQPPAITPRVSWENIKSVIQGVDLENLKHNL